MRSVGEMRRTRDRLNSFFDELAREQSQKLHAYTTDYYRQLAQS